MHVLMHLETLQLMWLLSKHEEEIPALPLEIIISLYVFYEWANRMEAQEMLFSEL